MDDINFLKNKKVIVFDLDGTIVNLTADWPTLKNILKKRYKELYNDSCEFWSISGCLSEIVNKNDEGELLKFFDIIRTYEMKNIKDTTPIEEIVYFIKHKKQFGVKGETKLAILSLNTRQTIKKSLELVGIENFFDLIIGREDVRSWKPSPEGLINIKNHFKVQKQDMVFFGDLENDIKTGKNADIDVYLIDVLIDLVKRNIS
jgi:phosphoglycolate phosphatase-like HAD superfamily hydrolase